MLKKLQKLDREGFTIIEVIIVLAIAALILLIVLLAVPALQRNARNTAVKNDASALASGISDFESNNNGATPTKFTGNNGAITFANATIATGATSKVQGATTVNGSTTGATFPVTTPPSAAAAAAGAIYIDSGESCPQNSVYTKSTRAFAIYYWTETPGIKSGTTNPDGVVNNTGLEGQCIDT